MIMHIKKEDLVETIRSLPNKKLSEIEKQTIFILLEKSKIKREHSNAILNNGFLIFFAFIIVAIFGKIYNLTHQLYINILFIFGMIVLVVSAIIYHKDIAEENKTLDMLLDSFLK